jgi:hypothetical protein
MDLYSNSPNVPPPPCSINSGLYTPPQSKGWWAGQCHSPDNDYYMYRVNHQDSMIPELYLHYPTNNRPGNNLTKLPGIVQYSTTTGNQNNVNLIEKVDVKTAEDNVPNIYNKYNHAFSNSETLDDKVMFADWYKSPTQYYDSYVNLPTFK